MKTLFILNDAPYGSERTHNGLRLADALSKMEGNEVRVFLIGDGASAAQSASAAAAWMRAASRKTRLPKAPAAARWRAEWTEGADKVPVF